jgi:hypothetical protein
MVGHDAPYPHNYERQSMAALESAMRFVDAIIGPGCPDCRTYRIEIAALRAKIHRIEEALRGS